MIKSFRTDKQNRKKELWEENKTSFQKFKINSKVIWRRFDTQTRGMGLFLIIMIGIIIISPIITAINGSIQSYMNKQKYDTALKIACLNDGFYSFNFEKCEDVGVRPQ